MAARLPSREPPSDPDSILTPDVEVTPRAVGDGDGDAATPEPDITKLGEAMRERIEIRSIAITGLFIFAVFYALRGAREFFLPIAFAILLNFLFSPVVRLLKRGRIPEPFGAAIVIAALLGIVGGGGYALQDPAREWAAKVPASLSSVGDKLRKVRRPVEQVTQTAEQVERAAGVSGTTRAPEVVVRGPSLGARVLGVAQSFLAGALETIVLLYFLLAAGNLFLEKLIKVLPHFRDKKKAVQIARETESSVSTYLFTVALINAGEGLVVTALMYLLHMPNPALWGVLVALLEFIPYIGAATMVAVLSFVALATFDSVWHAVLVPTSFLAVNLMQANLVTPLVLGRRLTLNPVAIFIGLIFWWWLWGIPGAFIAVPLLATLKIFCDHIETLAPVGEFLGK